MICYQILTPEHKTDILEFESQYAPGLPVYYRHSPDSLNSYIFKNKDGRAYGAFDGETLVGWAGYSLRKKGEYEMCGMIVHPGFRRRGIGLKLFQLRLDDLLKKPGAKSISATCYPANSPIIILYLTNGFVIYNFKKDYFGPGVDRLFLRYQPQKS